MINRINPFFHPSAKTIKNDGLNCEYDDEIDEQEGIEFLKRLVNPQDDENRTNLQETAEMISQVKENKTGENKSNTKESDAANVKEKDPYSDTAGTLARHYISKQLGESFLGNLTKVTPSTIAMKILGVDFEEDGNAFKDGVTKGKGGDYKQAFSSIIKNYDEAIKNAQKNGTWATVKESLKQTFGFIPNCGAAIVSNTLKYAGKALSKVLDNDFLSALGSGTAAVGKVLNSIGDSVANVLGGTFNGIKSLFKGDTTKASEAFKNMGNKFKEMGISIKNKFVDFFSDVKNFITKTIPQKFEEFGKKIKKLLPWNW